MPDQSRDRGGGAIALVVVFVSAAGFSAALTGVYLAMRDLMVNSGGACASGGAYQINPDQICSTGQTLLLMGGIFGGLLFAGGLIAGSSWYGGWRLTGVGLLLWAALFGTLGWNFLQLGFNPPANMSGGAGWIVCGVLFWLMALGGLIPGLMALASFFKDSAHPEEAKPLFTPPLVRANVNFERSMPGDPAQGISDPAAAAAAGQPVAQQPVTREAPTSGDFVDPVTGERHGGSDE